jgi:hypothetical protein
VTRKQVWQYKCEFCGKKRISASAMSKHEKHCTLNPDRECRLHSHGRLDPQVPMSELLEAIRLCKTENRSVFSPEKADTRDDSAFEIVRVLVDIEPLRKAARECPMCIFAALRQSGHRPSEVFDYMKELDDFWCQANEDAEQREYMTSYY